MDKPVPTEAVKPDAKTQKTAQRELSAGAINVSPTASMTQNVWQDFFASVATAHVPSAASSETARMAKSACKTSVSFVSRTQIVPTHSNVSTKHVWVIPVKNKKIAKMDSSAKKTNAKLAQTTKNVPPPGLYVSMVAVRPAIVAHKQTAQEV
tara:strand:- start:2724 stop:3179 length:456 start_codon:yes stop_codon:yes gene_type:complete